MMPGPAFIVDTDGDTRAVAFFERFDQAMRERNVLEPTPSREGGRWRFIVESYFAEGSWRRQDAALSKQRLSEIGGRLFSYTYS